MIDSYSRCRNIGGSLVRTMVLIYAPDDTSVHGSRTTQFKGSVSV